MTGPTQHNFKKSDFLNAVALSQKLGNIVDADTIYKIMESEYKKRTKFNIGTFSYELIYTAKWNHRPTGRLGRDYRLHPLGFDIFKEILTTQLNLGDKLQPYKWDFVAAIPTPTTGPDHEI